MDTIQTILATASIMILIEGLIVAIFPKQTIRGLKEIFKNKKNAVKVGLIEIILALLILFIISL